MILSTIASGMMALTAIVFSVAFVMVQFSATAYSPRLVMWLARSPVINHSIGIFTATFLYAIGALAWVDRDGSGRVPPIATWFAILLLFASVVFFVLLIEKIGMLQVTRILTATGDAGRTVISRMYPEAGPAAVGACGRPAAPTIPIARPCSSPSCITAGPWSCRPCARRRWWRSRPEPTSSSSWRWPSETR